MINFNIRSDVEGLKKLHSDLSEKQVNMAAGIAIKRTLQQVRTFVAKEVRQKYNMPYSALLSKIDMKHKGVGIYAVNSSPVSISYFSPRFSSTPFTNSRITKRGKLITKNISKKSMYRQGVSVEIIKGKRVTIPFAFMMPATNGNLIMGRGRYFNNDFLRPRDLQGQKSKITKLLSTSFKGTISNPTVKDGMYKTVESNIYPNLNHAFDAITKGYIKTK